MGWYSSVYRRRAAISVEISGGGPYDVNVTIPADWDEFWDAIDADGEDLRVVWYDSQTVLDYDVDDGAGGAFDLAGRRGRLRIDALTVPVATGSLLVWLYFAPSTAEGDGSTAVTITSPVNGHLELGTPGQHRLVHQSQAARTSRPRKIIAKTVNEQVFIWIRYDAALGKRTSRGRASRVYEEAFYATISVVNAAAADQSSMYDTDQLRWVWNTRTAELWLRCRVKAGSTNTRYTAVILTRTILPGATGGTQQLETRVGIDVTDSLES
jgi:hypothetical protein